MRIIQISAYYPPHLGGQENAVRDLSHHLALAGHDVHVVTSSKGGGATGAQLEDSVWVHRLKGWEFGHAPIMPAFLKTLLPLLTPDAVVHVHIGQAFTPEMVWLASRLKNIQFLAELHIDFEPSGPAGVLLPMYKKLVLKNVLQAAGTVAVLNDQTKRIVKENYAVKEPVIVSNGIDEQYFSLRRTSGKRKELNLLFVGRLSKQKNLPRLIKALSRLGGEVHLDVIGDGPERGEVEHMIKELSLSSRVTLHGRLDRSDVLKFYAQNDALVMPSDYEAQPLVLLEAMAARIPIIGTDVIGVAEHIKGSGIVVHPSEEGIVEGVSQLKDTTSLSGLVQKGYEKAEKLRWTNLLGSYEKLYQEMKKT